MTELKRQEFLKDFLQEFKNAKEEVRSWSPELQAEAAKTGVLAFPRKVGPDQSNDEAE